MKATLSEDGAAALSLAAGTAVGEATVEVRLGMEGRHHGDDCDSDSDH